MNIGEIKTGDNQSIISLQKKIDKDTVVTFGYDTKGSFSEVYTGWNYVVGSEKKSYSRIYRGVNCTSILKSMPEKYRSHVRELHDNINNQI